MATKASKLLKLLQEDSEIGNGFMVEPGNEEDEEIEQAKESEETDDKMVNHLKAQGHDDDKAEKIAAALASNKAQAEKAESGIQNPMSSEDEAEDDNTNDLGLKKPVMARESKTKASKLLKLLVEGVADTIKSQLGVPTLMRVGAHNFVNFRDTLTFAVGRGDRNLISITLNGMDGYDIQLKSPTKTVGKQDVPVENLRDCVLRLAGEA